MANLIARRGTLASQLHGDFAVYSDATHIMAFGSDANLPSGDITTSAWTFEWCFNDNNWGDPAAHWSWGGSVGNGNHNCMAYENAAHTQLQLTSDNGNYYARWSGLSGLANTDTIWQATCDGSGNMVLWQNGVSLGAPSTTGGTFAVNLGGATAFQFGSTYAFPAPYPGDISLGLWDRWAFWSSKLSDARLAAHAAQCFVHYAAYDAAVLADSPLQYYKTQEASGTVMVDAGSAASNNTYGTVGITLGQTGMFTG